MAYIFFVFILLVLYHFFFQNIILDMLLSLDRSKLYDLETRVDNLYKKKTISPIMHLAVKTLLNKSQEVLGSEFGFETYIIQEKKEQKNSVSTGLSIGQLMKRNKNNDLAEIITEWEDIMKDAYRYSYYAWIIYLIPLLMFRKIKSTLNRQQSGHIHKWLMNTPIASEAI